MYITNTIRRAPTTTPITIYIVLSSSLLLLLELVSGPDEGESVVTEGELVVVAEGEDASGVPRVHPLKLPMPKEKFPKSQLGSGGGFEATANPVCVPVFEREARV